MKKKINAYIKLQIPAGQARPAPPIGPALGQHGIRIAEFCSEFNNQTKSKMGTVLPTIITVYMDKSFSFIVKSPPASFLLKKAAGLKTEGKPGSGSKEPGKNKVGSVTLEQIKKIAEEKKDDLNSYDINAAVKIISGTARSMGIDIKKNA